MRLVRIENQSANHASDINAALPAIHDALHVQLLQVARAWGDYVFGVTTAIGANGWHIALIDNPDMANALGYHDVAPDGTPYARVFIDPVLDNAGSILHGSLSVSAVISHEVCEAICDPGANRWADDWHGTAYALELCDATENDTYDINTTYGPVAVSNFLYPNYFNPLGAPPYDHMGLIQEPFAIRPHAYAIKWDAQGISQVFGDGDYPHARLATKWVPGGRTRTRLGG